MTTSVEHAVSRIYGSLELLQQDLDIERSGGRIDFYFDTADACVALRGFHEYVDWESQPHQLKKEKFNELRTLVDCLLASDWLGPFYLLSPHQAEFVRLLDDGRMFPQEQRRRDLSIDEFLELLGLGYGRDHPPIKELNGEELYDFVRQQADTAEEAFKAVQCILYRAEERLKIWHGTDLLLPTPHKFDYTRLTNTAAFSRILDAFETVRIGQYYNNFADAVALSMLLVLCREANKREEKHVPRFFDSHGFFRRIAKRAQVEDALCVELSNGARTPVLVDADYFVNKAIFRSRSHGAEIEAPPAVNPEELLDRLRQISGYGEENQSDPTASMDLEALDRITIGKMTLREVVNDLSELSFLKNIWLDQLARDELAKFAERFDAVSVESEEFKSGVQDVIDQTKNKLKANTEAYERLNTIWHNLKSDILALRKKLGLSPVDQKTSNIMIRDMDLLRFSLPGDIKAKIIEIMAHLLDKKVPDEHVTRLEQWSQLVDAYFEGRRTPETSLGKAQVAAAVLWRCGKYEEIIHLLEDIAGKGNPQSIDFLYAAACFRSGHKHGRGEDILHQLVDMLTSLEGELDGFDEERYRRAADLSVGIGYLFFHLWHSRNYAVEWREAQLETSKKSIDEDGRNLLRAAINSARKAVEMIKVLEVKGGSGFDLDMQMKKVYAVNQKLYYLTELGPAGEDEIQEMDAASTDLSEYKDASPDLWQPTFYDTLARHSHFLATRARKIGTRIELLEEAVKQSKKAEEDAPHNDLIIQYHRVVLHAKAKAEEDAHQRQSESVTT